MVTIEYFIGRMIHVYTRVLSWISEAFNFVYNNPVLLLILCLAIAGIIMRMVRKWIPGF